MTTYMRDRIAGMRRTLAAATRTLCALTVMVTLLAGCDVTNPGPVQDDFLGDPATQQGMVNGSITKLLEAVNGGGAGALLIVTAAVSREILPGGNTNFGMAVITQGGHIAPGTYGGYFERAQQARFIGEEAIARFAERGAPQNMNYQAHLWTGFAYRVLGENWCEAVIDGSGLLPNSVYFENAESRFTEALSLASGDSERYAALAGRAQARIFLSDFAGAASDAGGVPTSFRFDLDHEQGIFNLENALQVSNANLPYRAFTVHFTFQFDYYTDTGDPRTEWVVDPNVAHPNGTLSGYQENEGRVPWSNQTKYSRADSPTRLAGGTEMRLIEAEVLLRNGNWEDALELINEVRTGNVSDITGVALEPWEGSSVEEVGAALKREHSIELWLEARHMSALRRWGEQSTPGAFELPNFEVLTPLFTTNPRSDCFDVPDGEREANPNIPTV